MNISDKDARQMAGWFADHVQTFCCLPLEYEFEDGRVLSVQDLYDTMQEHNPEVTALCMAYIDLHDRIRSEQVNGFGRRY